MNKCAKAKYSFYHYFCNLISNCAMQHIVFYMLGILGILFCVSNVNFTWPELYSCILNPKIVLCFCYKPASPWLQCACFSSCMINHKLHMIINNLLKVLMRNSCFTGAVPLPFSLVLCFYYKRFHSSEM